MAYDILAAASTSQCAEISATETIEVNLSVKAIHIHFGLPLLVLMVCVFHSHLRGTQRLKGASFYYDLSDAIIELECKSTC